jgi:hypothetical protein
MALPWMGILDAAIGMANMALSRRAKTRAGVDDKSHQIAGGANLGTPGALETHLAGVVVAALKEVFERDSRRLDLERELAEAERERAERALRLELRRQAGDREIGRLRLMVGVAVAGWLGTLLLSVRLIGGSVAARVVLGSGGALLLAALVCAFVGLSSVSRALAGLDGERGSALEPSLAAALAAAFIIAGLALIGVAAVLA